VYCPYNTHQLFPSNQQGAFSSVLYTINPSAGDGIDVIWVLFILGIRNPLEVDEISNMADGLLGPAYAPNLIYVSTSKEGVWIISLANNPPAVKLPEVDKFIPDCCNTLLEIDEPEVHNGMYPLIPLPDTPPPPPDGKS